MNKTQQYIDKMYQDLKRLDALNYEEYLRQIEQEEQDLYEISRLRRKLDKIREEEENFDWKGINGCVTQKETFNTNLHLLKED